MIQDAPAVWAAIDVVAKEDEPASPLTGVLLALFNEALQLRLAAVGVTDRISAGHSTIGPSERAGMADTGLMPVLEEFGVLREVFT